MSERPVHRAVYLLFFASGMAGLVYQVVWFRMLARLMGVTIYATATVVAAFMGGLALGSYLFGRYVDRQRNPLRIYAVLELCIGLAAVIVPPLLFASAPLLQWVYAATGDSGAVVLLARAVLTFAVLLVPTTMMGGTLPVLTAHLTRREGLVGHGFSLLYGINTAGAVIGVLVSGFIAIGLLGEWGTIGLAVAINLLVAIVAFWLARTEAPAQDSAADHEGPGLGRHAPAVSYSDAIRRMVLGAFFLSGFTALAYEIIWTRQLILFLRTSVYAFSGMLAVFLSGIALGSIVLNRRVDRMKTPVGWFGMMELGVATLSLLTLYLFAPLDSHIARRLLGLSNAFYATVGIVFPLTFMFGVITPVAVVAFARSTASAGSSVGRLYSANTVGSIFGSLAAGFLLVPSLGASRTVLLLGLVNLALGVLLTWMEPGFQTRRRLVQSAVAGLLLIGFLRSWGLDPFRTVIERRIEAGIGVTWMPDSNATLPPSHRIYLHNEGREATLTAFEVNRWKQLWINGVGMVFFTTATKLMAHLPLLLADDPKEFLAVGFGMGTSPRSALLHPGVHVTAVDLVPATFETFEYYHADGGALRRSGRLTLLVNDARNQLLLSPKRYDAITVDPAPPVYAAGTVNLYTREFFALARARLTPGGVLAVWFPGGTEIEVKTMIRTFASVFPDATIWSGPNLWGYHLIGTMHRVDWDRFDRRLAAFYADSALHRDVVEWESSVITSDRLRALLIWQPEQLDSLTAGAPLNTDNFPFTEFPLWRYAFGGQRLWHPRSTWLNASPSRWASEGPTIPDPLATRKER
jgi:spermidine synthase